MLFRSLMFVPAHNERFMISASIAAADILLLDLEDSVQPVENKQIARDRIINYIQEGKFQDRILFPRVNDRESGQLLKDVIQLTIKGISGFMYPKANKGEDIYFFGKLLETIEYEKGYPLNTFKIIPLIETASAVVNVKDICEVCPNRTVAIAFGCEDYVTSLQAQHDDDGISIFMARAAIVSAARAAGIEPIDTVHIKVHDLIDLEKNLILSRKMGFEGMLVLNPKEIPLVHQYYSPSCEDVAWANEMILLADDSAKSGKGVAIKGNKFIGPPMVKMAYKILEKQLNINLKKDKDDSKTATDQ
jgi:citrate lyase subunit beta/citryl-CoA lyase